MNGNSFNKKIVIAIGLIILIAFAYILNKKSNEQFIEYGSLRNEANYVAKLNSSNCEYALKINNKEDINFQDDKSVKEVTIEKYKENDDILVIDSQVDDFKVTNIKSDAFVMSTNLDRIYIDKELTQDLELEDFQLNHNFQDDNYDEYVTTREYTDIYKRYLALNDDEKSNIEIIPNKYEVPTKILYSKELQEAYNLKNDNNEESLPQKFDLRDEIIMEVENQNGFNICYTYGTLEALETNLAITKGEYADFSEVHLGAFYGPGGQFISESEEYFANQIGPVYETYYPISQIYNNEETEECILINKYLKDEELTLEEKDAIKNKISKIKPTKKLTKTITLPSIASTNEKKQEEVDLLYKTVKTHIKKYGALAAAIDASTIIDGHVNYHSRDYYYNHMVCLIGWDDNYPKENFACEPMENGAWIVQNSWGESFGDNGYFYVSYEDISFGLALYGVISIEDTAEKFEIVSMDMKNLNNNVKYEKNNRIIKGDNLSIDINVKLNEILENADINVTIIDKDLNDVTEKFAINKNSIINDKMALNITVDTKMLESGNYILNLNYDDEIITREIKVYLNDFDFYINDDQSSITLTKYVGDSKNVIIPITYLGYSVSKIDTNIFKSKDIISLTVESDIVEIGENAIPNDTVIYGNENSTAQQYARQNGLTFIRNGENNITGDGWEYDFINRKLYINNKYNDQQWRKYNKVIREVVLSSEIDSISEWEFQGCFNLETINLNNINEIGDYAFYGCTNIKGLNFSNVIKKIGAYAFAYCEELERIDISNHESLEIGSGAFRDCKNLKEIYIDGDYLYKYANSVYYNCSKLEKINLPNTMSIIPYGMFENCYKLKEVRNTNNITEVQDRAFYNCYSLENINIPNIETIGTQAFYNCNSLTNINAGENLSIISYNAFGYCFSLKNMQALKVKDISDWAFNNCKSLEYIRVSDDLNSIGEGAFSFCESLKSIDLNDITEIKDQTFAYCSSLKNYSLNNKLTEIGINGFIECDVTNLFDYINEDTIIGGYAFCNAKYYCYVDEPYYRDTVVELPDIVKLYDNNIKNNGNLSYFFEFEQCEPLENERIKLNKQTNEDFTNDIMAVIHTNFDSDIFELQICFKRLEKEPITLNKEKLVMKIGEQEVLKADINLHSTTNQNIIWSSSANNIVTVDENGKVSAISAGKATITATTVEQNKTAICEVEVNEKQLSSIVLTKLPTQTQYIQNYETLNLDGGVLTLIYDDTTTEEISLDNEDVVISGFDNSKIGKNTLTITYQEKTTTLDVYIIEKELTEIIITKEPTNKNYIEGQDFDSSGMKITAKYNDGSNKEVSNYTVTDGDNLTTDKTSVTISYTENSVTKTTTQSIIVNSKSLISISVTTSPNKTTYIESQNFDPTGMKVTATYNNSSSKEITNYTIIDGNNLTTNKTYVTISYTEDGITKKTTQAITVTQKLEISFIGYSEVKQDGIKFIDNIDPGTTMEEMINNVKTNGTIKVYKDDREITDNKINISTGMKVKISLNNENYEFTVVVKGDTNGDGESNLKDLLQINKHRLNKAMLTAEYLLAGDVNKDNEVDVRDLLQVNKYRLGKIKTF